MKSETAILHIKLLGSPQVTDENGRPLSIMKMDKGMALLAYLIITGHSHNREALADLLWDADSTNKSQQNLRKLLSRMRQTATGLQITRKDVSFVPTGAVDIDLFTLRLAIAGEDNQALDEALKSVNGNLLDRLYLEDAPRFDEWLAIEAERVRQQIMSAYDRVCTIYAQEKNWPRGIEAAQRWLVLDELNEIALLHLMHMLAASGQVGLALQQYEFTRQRLWDELGVEPETEIIALAQQLEEMKTATGEGLAWAVALEEQFALPKPEELAEPGTLPSHSFVPYLRNNDFTGRRESLLYLASFLLPREREVENQAAALTGMGGLGKTQIAVEFCYRYGRFFPGGVYWLNFADADNVAEEVTRIGGERGMGLYRESDNLRQADKIGRVTRAWQEPIPRLLIFDNCEEVALLQKWLPVTGGCSVLLTSQRANWPRELHISERQLTVLDANESTRFLRNLVPMLAGKDAADIAEELGYLPLALHLAGSFLRRYRGITAGQYLIQLRDKSLLAHPSLQGRGTDLSPTGHELDVARTFAINWEQLNTADEIDAAALKLLAGAAQFAPGESIPRDLLLSLVVSDETDMMQSLLAEDGLARLMTLGFINATGKAMLSIHRLVIAFVQTVVADVAGIQTAVADIVWKHIQAQWGIGTLLDQLVVPPAHVKFIMEKELLKGTAPGVHLAHAWGRYLLDAGDFAGSRIYLEQALALNERVYGTDMPETADILVELGTLAWYADSDQAAWPLYQHAYTIYKQHFGEDHFKTCHSLTPLAILQARAGEYDAAIDKYERVLAIYGQVLPPDDQRVGLVLQNLAEAYRRMGQYRVALNHFEKCLLIRRKMWSDDHPRILTTLSSMGMAYFLMGDYQSAYDYFLRAYNGRRKRLGENHHLTAFSLSNMGAALGFMGNFDEAISHLRHALDQREKIFGLEHTQLAYTLTYLGVILQEMGEIQEAQLTLERAVTIQEGSGVENEETAETLTYCAAVLIQTGKMETARAHLQRAQDFWARRPDLIQSRAAATHICWGAWWEIEGDTGLALSYYKQALSVLTGQVAETHRGWQQVQAHLTRLGQEA